uniref:Uncharacterized protein n=1 Tax=Caulerpa ashmeadii TaxID=177078 RepID=A0A6B9VZ14_9CHLO|nr:hypothetical protein [Caulerpa ashmeadii]QHQ73330.1 hypothetical protein [Caulerpa ashmeadii]
MCHDVGNSIPPSFVNLRTLFLQEKYKMFNGKTESTGLKVLSLIKNLSGVPPGTGILDRRMVYVPFINREKNQEIKAFEVLFPSICIFCCTTKSSKNKIVFTRSLQQQLVLLVLESFQDNRKSFGKFCRKLTFCENSWTPLGRKIPS